MSDLLDYAPIAAAAFAIPQFLPQTLKLRATDDVAGVSWSWATVTSVNNAAWFAYFALSGFWMALVPSSSATLLAGALATMLALRGQAEARPAVLIGAWAAVLAAGFSVAGRTGLGTLLTAAFILRSRRRSGPPTEHIAQGERTRIKLRVRTAMAVINPSGGIHLNLSGPTWSIPPLRAGRKCWWYALSGSRDSSEEPLGEKPSDLRYAG